MPLKHILLVDSPELFCLSNMFLCVDSAFKMNISSPVIILRDIYGKQKGIDLGQDAVLSINNISISLSKSTEDQVLRL